MRDSNARLIEKGTPISSGGELADVLFAVFFNRNWIKLGFALVLLLAAPILLICWLMFKCIGFLWPEARPALVTITFICIGMIACKPIIDRSVAEHRLTRMEQTLTTNQARAVQVCKLNQEFGEAAQAYLATGQVPVDQVKRTAKQQIAIADKALATKREFSYHSGFKQIDLYLRYEKVSDTNRKICQQLAAVRDSAEHLLQEL